MRDTRCERRCAIEETLNKAKGMLTALACLNGSDL